MTSFIAAGGSGRSPSVIPAVPAASSVTTIAFIWDLPVAGPSMPPAGGRWRPPSAPSELFTPTVRSRLSAVDQQEARLAGGGEVDDRAEQVAVSVRAAGIDRQ